MVINSRLALLVFLLPFAVVNLPAFAQSQPSNGESVSIPENASRVDSSNKTSDASIAEDTNAISGASVARRPEGNGQDLAIPTSGESVAPQPQGNKIAQTPSTDSNTDRFLSPTELPSPLPPSTPLPTPQAPTPSAPAPSGNAEVRIQKVEIEGSTVFTDDDFAPLLEPIQGRTVPFSTLQDLVAKINQKYQEAGYLNTLATLPNQDLSQGIARIQVFEGRLSKVEINGLTRTNEGYVRSRLENGFEEGKPLRVRDVEDQLRLLRANPLFEKVNAFVRATDKPGETELVVELEENNWVTGNLFVDNYSPPSVGSVRYGANVAFRNLTGWGDELRIGHTRSTTGGSRISNFGYSIPVNSMEGTLSLNVVLDRNKITLPPFDRFNIEGESELYEASFRQPLIRTSQEEFALSVGFSHKTGQTFVFDQPTPFGIGPEANGTSRVSVFRFGQDYLRRDAAGAWALRSQFNLGTGLLDATINPSPIPDSRFFSWLGQVQRVQQLDPNNLLIAQIDAQLSGDSLLPSEQFTIGGGTSVRGYRSNARSGDNGVRFSLEERWVALRDDSERAVLQFAPFFDAGWVWNKGGNPNTLPSQRFLAGIGAGIIFTPIEKVTARLQYGYPLVKLRDRGYDATDDGFYFNVNYQF